MLIRAASKQFNFSGLRLTLTRPEQYNVASQFSEKLSNIINYTSELF